jgi:hypothetical protein
VSIVLSWDVFGKRRHVHPHRADTLNMGKHPVVTACQISA